MKAVVVGAVAALLMLGLSGCGDTVESIERDAKVKQVCEDNGGRVYYNGGIRCSFATKGER